MIREMWYIKALRGDYRDQGWKPYVGMDQEEMGGIGKMRVVPEHHHARRCGVVGSLGASWWTVEERVLGRRRGWKVRR